MKTRVLITTGLALAGMVLFASGWIFAADKNMIGLVTEKKELEYSVIPSRGLAVNIELETTKVKLGDAFDIILTLKNTTEEKMEMMDTSPNQDCRFMIYDADGNHVPLSVDGKRLEDVIEHGWNDSSRRPWTLDKDMSTTKSMNAGRLFLIKKPGKYHIIAMYKTKEKKGWGWNRLFAISNMVTLEVVN